MNNFPTAKDIILGLTGNKMLLFNLCNNQEGASIKRFINENDVLSEYRKM